MQDKNELNCDNCNQLTAEISELKLSRDFQMNQLDLKNNQIEKVNSEVNNLKTLIKSLDNIF
jgi:hypothetical protein